MRGLESTISRNEVYMSFDITKVLLDPVKIRKNGGTLNEIAGERNQTSEMLIIGRGILKSPILIRFINGAYFVDPVFIKIRSELLTSDLDPVIDYVEAQRTYNDPRVVKILCDHVNSEEKWIIAVTKQPSMRSSKERKHARLETVVTFRAQSIAMLEALHRRIVNGTIYGGKPFEQSRPNTAPNRAPGMRRRQKWSTR